MRACDRFAIEKLKLPGLLLMENAGRGVVETMQEHYGALRGKSVVLFCGKGSNGGDGFVAARHLFNLGAMVTVVLVGKKANLQGDARINFSSLQNIAKLSDAGARCQIIGGSITRILGVLPKPDFIIDALFGTGFSGEIRGEAGQVIEYINRTDAKTVSVDVPSGVNSDSGQTAKSAVKADLTVTFGAKKIGITIGEGREYAGLVKVIDISIPQIVLDKFAPLTFEVQQTDVRRVLPLRSPKAHKHSVGKVLVVAGSAGLTGAAALTSTSVLRAGAGTVVLLTPGPVYPILAKKLTEVMVRPLEENLTYDSIEKQVDWADVVVVGPGLSTASDARELVWSIVQRCGKPLLIDADGLNVLAMDMAVLKKKRSKNIVLTPHAGEFARLSGLSSALIEEQRVVTAREFAREHKVTLVLKGAPTVTANEHGKLFINSTGNPGMATAGAGDVLSGLVAGLWGQGMERSEAAYAGVFIHGLAGDMARAAYGEKSMMATDIQNEISSALRFVEEGRRR